MKKFSIVKFITYLTIGLCVLGSWGYVNYTNYTVNEHRAQVEITENVTMINEVVEEIEIEQNMLRMEQQVAPPETHAMRLPPMSRESRAPASVAPTPPNTSSRFDALEARILELEAEKEELKAEKMDIKEQIKETFNLFKLDYENPMVNAVVIPVLLYFLKKLLDLGFARIEERLHHNFEEECEDEA